MKVSSGLVQSREVPAGLEIIRFEQAYALDFKALNFEWLRRYFRVEPIDHEVLSAPQRIIEDGGCVLLARQGSDIVGTAALLSAGDQRYELSKMAVTERCQGRGIGRALLTAILAVYQDLNGCELFLESNRLLVPALALYRSVGFREVVRPAGPTHYQRADIYMRYNA